MYRPPMRMVGLVFVATFFSAFGMSFSQAQVAEGPFDAFKGNDPYLHKLLTSELLPIWYRPSVEKTAAMNGQRNEVGRVITVDPTALPREIEQGANQSLFGGQPTPAEGLDVLRGRLTRKAREERALILERTKPQVLSAAQKIPAAASKLLFDTQGVIVALDNEIAMLRGEMPNATEAKQPPSTDATIPDIRVPPPLPSNLAAPVELTDEQIAATIDSLFPPSQPPTVNDVLSELSFLTSLSSKDEATLHQFLTDELKALESAFKQHLITADAYEDLTQELLDKQKLLSMANDVAIANDKGIDPALIQPDDLLGLYGAAKGLKGLIGSTIGLRSESVKEIVKWTPLNGPGPLGDLAASFRSSTYTESILTEEITLYRSYGGKAEGIGRFWTQVPPTGPLQAKIDSALAFGNTAKNVVAVRVPAGTKIYEGIAAPQKVLWPPGHGMGFGQGAPAGNLLGGGSQVFIPKVDPSWIVR